MALRHLSLIAALTVPAILAVTGTGRRAQPASSYAQLRIESLSAGRLQVTLSSVPPGLSFDSAQSDEVRLEVVGPGRPPDREGVSLDRGRPGPPQLRRNPLGRGRWAVDRPLALPFFQTAVGAL